MNPETIYQRDLDAFKGPKRRAREQAIRKFRAIITFWSLLGKSVSSISHHLTNNQRLTALYPTTFHPNRSPPAMRAG